jgi:hypothetical protein
MKFFICWSGVRSQRLAQAFGSRITKVIPKERLQRFLPYEIEPGTRWFKSVRHGIGEADVARTSSASIGGTS